MFTLVIPTCDRPAMLRRAVASLLAQDVSDWRAVVVDDGAAATAAGVVPADDPRIATLRTRGREGAAAARNLGLAQAGSAWTLFLDDDDELLPGGLRAFAAAASAGDPAKPALVIGAQNVLRYGPGDVVAEARIKAVDRAVTGGALVHQALRFGACGLAVNAAALCAVRGFDLSYRLVEDTEFILRLCAARARILATPEPAVTVHTHADPTRLSGVANHAARIAEIERLERRFGTLDGRFEGLPALLRAMAQGLADQAAAAGEAVSSSPA